MTSTCNVMRTVYCELYISKLKIQLATISSFWSHHGLLFTDTSDEGVVKLQLDYNNPCSHPMVSQYKSSSALGSCVVDQVPQLRCPLKFLLRTVQMHFYGLW